MPIRFPVVGQRVCGRIFTAAFIAFEGRPPLSRLPIREMGVLMQIKIVEIREAIRTDVTAVRQLIAVAAYMIDKFRGKFEKAAAAGDGAAVALLAQVGAQVGAVQRVLAEPLRAEPTVVEALEGQRAILAKEQHTIVQFGGLQSREAVRGKFIGLRRMFKGMAFDDLCGSEMVNYFLVFLYFELERTLHRGIRRPAFRVFMNFGIGDFHAF